MTQETKDLPPIHFWMARSTYAMILTALTTLAAAFNVELLAYFGTSEDSLLQAVDAMLPLISAVWLWSERRNPKFRIST